MLPDFWEFTNLHDGHGVLQLWSLPFSSPALFFCFDRAAAGIAFQSRWTKRPMYTLETAAKEDMKARSNSSGNTPRKCSIPSAASPDRDDLFSNTRRLSLVEKCAIFLLVRSTREGEEDRGGFFRLASGECSARIFQVRN